MNKNNLSWVNNKVFNNPGAAQSTIPPMRPFMDTAPAQYNMPAAGAAAAPTGLSPTQGLSPATYQEAKTPEPAGSGISPATYQNMPLNNNGQMGMPPTAYMSPMPSGPASLSPTGVSPAQYQTQPPVYPVQTGQTPTTGMESGTGTQGTLTRTTAYGASPISIQGPPTVLDPGYTPAYLRTQIGKRVRAEFNIGTNLYMDRTGVLREVGISYFVIEDNVTHVRVMCDLYSLKFLTSEA
jgi:hypothetical protein